MEKIELLRYLSNADFFPLLSNGELKLYILLLVKASDIETIEKMGLKEIKKANGNMPSLAELKATMASLERNGLAVMEEIKGWPVGELRFRLKRPFITAGAYRGRKRRIKWQKR